MAMPKNLHGAECIAEMLDAFAFEVAAGEVESVALAVVYRKNGDSRTAWSCARNHSKNMLIGTVARLQHDLLRHLEAHMSSTPER